MIPLEGALLIISALMLAPMTGRGHYVGLLLPYYLIVAGVLMDRNNGRFGIAALGISYSLSGIPREIVPSAFSEFMRMHSDIIYATLILIVYFAVLGHIADRAIARHQRSLTKSLLWSHELECRADTHTAPWRLDRSLSPARMRYSVIRHIKQRSPSRRITSERCGSSRIDSFNPTTGAGFWGIGATEWSTPMILMGQEYGEPFGLGFRRSDFMRGRFEGTAQFNPNGEALVDFYGLMFRARRDNDALRSTFPDVRAFLRAKGPNGPTVDPRIFAQVRGKKGGGNVVFMFHNLFEQGTVSNSYFVPPDIGDALGIDVQRQFRLVDLISGQQQGPCHSGADIRNDIFIQLDQGTRMQWLQLQLCQ
jgi:hypothetical protein